MRAPETLYRLALTCAVGALFAGCRDVAAPTQSAADDHALPQPASSALTFTEVFTYDPAVGATFTIAGQHQIQFPANAICDPAFSSYGVKEWDKPCTPYTTPVVITAVAYRDVSGHPRVDFSPELRFVPGRPVVLYLRDKAASQDPTAVIKWCGPDGTCVEEAAYQPAYQTKRDPARGVVYRAIKHFSGYLISAGWDRVGL